MPSPRLRSERSNLDVFVVPAVDARLRDQQDLMERPFFSLSKSRRTTPIVYKAGEIEVQVMAMPQYGMASIWDADVLIWAASQIVRAENEAFRSSRYFRFTPYQLLTAIGRATGATEYRLLKGALMRLQSTVVATNIRHGQHWRRQQFSWINEWEELATRSGRVEGMEFVLPEWFYRGVIDRSLVLNIDPRYFKLRGGIERWLYRIARKHAGRQVDGWAFDVTHLHAKSGSLARVSDFALDLRKIASRQSLPGYTVYLELDGRRTFLRIIPSGLSIGIVDKPVNGLVRSGAETIVTSGAALSGHRAHGTDSTLCSETENCALNLDSNFRSNSLVVENGAPARTSSIQSVKPDFRKAAEDTQNSRGKLSKAP